MRKDFTKATYDEIVKYVEDKENMNFFQEFCDGAQDTWLWIKNLFRNKSKINNGSEKMKKYYKEVIDMRDYMVEQLYNFFKLSNDLDDSMANRAGVLVDSGNEVYSAMVRLEKIMSNYGLNAAAEGAFWIDNYTPSKDVEFDSDCKENGSVVITSHEQDITDERIIVACQASEHEYLNLQMDYSRLYLNAGDAVNEMGGWDVFLIALFQHTDINIGNLLHTPHGADVWNEVKKSILNEEDGYDTIDDIANEMGISREEVIAYLKGKHINTIHRDQLGQINNRNAGNSFGFNDDLALKQKFDSIIERNLRNMLNDEALSIALCEKLGMDPELAKAIVNGEINGHDVEEEKEIIAKSIASVLETTQVEVYPGELKKILKLMKNSNSLFSETEKGEALKKMLSNGVLSDKEARKFLKDYCGYASASESDIKNLRFISTNMNAIGSVDKMFKLTQEGMDALAYWLSDYTAENAMLEKMMQCNAGDATYKYVLQQIKIQYNDKFLTTLSEAADKLVEKAVGETLKQVPLYGAVNAAIDIAGTVTGLKGRADAASGALYNSIVVSNSIDAYKNACEAIRINGDTSEEAIMRVRTSFAFMKESLKSYYEDVIKYAKKTHFDEPHYGADDYNLPEVNTNWRSYNAYLEYELAEINKMKIGSDVDVISYTEYLARIHT